ncbi:hypothetical protein LTR85_001045 [Meristemomyces frigidus]|nr:hypothetical protein LTR85_001045 [Meristemomyces frigidus]
MQHQRHRSRSSAQLAGQKRKKPEGSSSPPTRSVRRALGTGEVAFKGMTASLPRSTSRSIDHAYGSRVGSATDVRQHESPSAVIPARGIRSETSPSPNEDRGTQVAVSPGEMEARAGGYGHKRQLSMDGSRDYSESHVHDRDDERENGDDDRKRQRRLEGSYAASPRSQRSYSVRWPDSLREESSPPRSSIQPACFLDQLILCIERYHELRREEKEKLGAQQPSEEQAQTHARRLRIYRERQHARVAHLYKLTDTRYGVLGIRFDKGLQRMHPTFFAVLSGNIRAHARLQAPERNVDLAHDDWYQLQGRLDDMIRTRAKLEKDLSRRESVGEMARILQIIEQIHLGITEAEENFLRSRQTLERMFEEQRRREDELYRLAEPVLLEEGLLARDAVDLAKPEPPKALQRLVKPIGQQPRVVADAPPPIAKLNEPNPNDVQEKPAIRTVDKVIRDAMLREFNAARQVLGKAKDTLEVARANDKKEELKFEEEMRKRNMTGTKQQYDQLMYLKTKDCNAEIREAEARYDYAKRRAAEVGVLPPNQSSDFASKYPDDCSAGADSDVQKRMAAFDAGPVEAWRPAISGIPEEELADPNAALMAGEEPGLDAFDVREMVVGESLSTIAVGRQRERLDRYGAGPRGTAWTTARGFGNGKGMWE